MSAPGPPHHDGTHHPLSFTSPSVTLAGQLSPAQAVTELSGAVDYLLARPSATGSAAGVVGFCMGGAFVLQ
jgi:dienelactone hydrolase